MGNSPLRQLGQSSGLLPRSELALLHAAARGDFESVKLWHKNMIDQGVFSPSNQTVRQSFSFKLESSHKATSVPTSPTNAQSINQAPSIDVNYHLPDGDFALMLAASHGNVEFVEYLVEELNCDVDNVDNHGCTALMTAIQQRALDIVRFLCLDGQCELSIMDEKGQNAMHYAAMQESSEILRFLCTIDANESLVAAKDMKGNTPLLSLLLENRLAESKNAVQQMAVALIDAGSEPSWCNLDGINAWQAANQRDMKEQNMFEIAESGTAGILATAVRRRQRKRRQVVQQVFNVFELVNSDSGVDDSIKTDQAIDDILDVIASYDNHQAVPSDLAVASPSPSMTPTHRSHQPSISQLSPIATPRSTSQINPVEGIELAAVRGDQSHQSINQTINQQHSTAARALTINPAEDESKDSVAELGSTRGLLSEGIADVKRTSSQTSLTSP